MENPYTGLDSFMVRYPTCVSLKQCVFVYYSYVVFNCVFVGLDALANNDNCQCPQYDYLAAVYIEGTILNWRCTECMVNTRIPKVTGPKDKKIGVTITNQLRERSSSLRRPFPPGYPRS